MNKSKYVTIDPESITQQQRHSYLLSSIAPRPIAFASTIDKEGNVNLSPFSFFNVFSSNPPIVVFSPARNARDLSLKHTLENLYEVPETVINMVSYSMVEQMSLASTSYPKGINESVKAGLEEIPSDMVKPPRVGESPASFECVVEEIKTLGEGPGAGNLVIARVVMMHFQENLLNQDGKIDPTRLDLVGRMGGPWYTHSSTASLFSIPKPLRSLGIGVDSLPSHTRNSDVLTGNQLGRLGNLQALPSSNTIDQIKNDDRYLDVMKHHTDEKDLIKSLHLLAVAMIEEEKVEAALAVLMTIQDK